MSCSTGRFLHSSPHTSRRGRARSIASLTAVVTSSAATTLLAAAFHPANILVTEGNELTEYTLAGEFVQSFDIPHPDTTRHDGNDVVVAADGAAFIRNSAPFDNDYFSRLDPVTGNWTHILADGIGFGNVSDADLSARGNSAVTNGRRLNLITQEVADLGIGGGEVSWGLDGLLYALDTGSPRSEIRVFDPSDYSQIRSFRVDFVRSLRGIAVTRTGKIFAADWDGMIYEYMPDGTFVQSQPTGLNNLLDLDLRPDGTLIAGSRIGDVAATDTSLNSFFSFDAGSDLAYVAFTVTVPEPATSTSALLALAWLRFGVAPRRTTTVKYSEKP